VSVLALSAQCSQRCRRSTLRTLMREMAPARELVLVRKNLVIVLR
jgi:hypothetical protein